MARVTLFLLAAMLVWVGVRTTQELADGVFPGSLALLFVLIGALFAHPSLSVRWGRGAWTASLLSTAAAFALLLLGPRLARDGSRRAAREGEPVQTAAAQATYRFHAALSEGRFADICAVAEPGAFQAVTELSCPELLAYLHGKVGGFVSRSTAPWYVEKKASSPRIAVEVDTRYENAEARESFDWRIAEDPEAVRLVSYRVQF